MTNEERAAKIVDDWDRFHRWRADEHSPVNGAKFPKLQEMIRDSLDEPSEACYCCRDSGCQSGCRCRAAVEEAADSPG